MEKKKESPLYELNAWLVFLFCFGVTFASMFFFSVNSPMYTFNSHCDFQWYLTVGRGLADGKVPYRDLFEQKGPIVYFVFAFASLFPNPSVVIWLIEIVCLSLFLYFAYRIARKFLSPYTSLAVIPLAMLLLCSFTSGLGATRVEEFCMPIFAYGLLCFLDFLMKSPVVRWRRSLGIGVCLGILFWVKYSMWLFFFVPMVIWVVLNFMRHQFKLVLLNGLIMLGGIALITLPVLLYFIFVDGLSSLWEVYFLTNIFCYTGDIKGLTEKQLNAAKWGNIINVFLISPLFLLLYILGLVCFVIQFWHQKSGWLLLVPAIITTFLVGFFCGYTYYYLPLFAYALLGVVYVVKMIVGVLQKVDVVVCKHWKICLLLATLTVFSFMLSVPVVPYVVEMNQSRENYAPLVVADIISEYNQSTNKEATLFCYQMADCGFYNAAGIVPNVRFFAKNCFTEDSLPEMYQAFDRTISEQYCDFVVTYLDIFEKHKDLLLQYYDFYFETKELSTLPYIAFVEYGYLEMEIVILFRKNLN